MQTTRGSWAPEDWLHLKARAHTPLRLAARMRCRAPLRKKARSEGEGEDEEAHITRNPRKRSLIAGTPRFDSEVWRS